MIEDLKKHDDVDRHLERVKEQKVIDEKQIKQSERQRLKKELGHEYVSSDSENERKSKGSNHKISVDNFNDDILTPISSLSSQKENINFVEHKKTDRKRKESKGEDQNLKNMKKKATEEFDLNKKYETSYFPIKKLADYLEKNKNK